MIIRGTSFPAYDDDFLALDFDYVSPLVDDASVTHDATAGRDGRGCVVFTPGNDDNPFSYDQCVQEVFDEPNAAITIGFFLDQIAAQGALGGRLLTLIDAPVDVFGFTTQVGIDLLSDNTIRIVRSTDQGSGFILRGPDQGSDSQVTVLGTSPAVTGDFVEIKVVLNHAGSVTIQVDNASFYTLSGVNTAPSGLNQATGYALGGFAATNVAGDTRLHYDLNARISDLHVINSVVSGTDPNNPTDFIGDHHWWPSTMEADGDKAEYTPDPVQDHYLNINEDPPDSGDTENSAAAVDLVDSFMSTDVAGTGTDEVIVSNRAFLKTDGGNCITDELAEFEAFVYMEQTDPGEVHTSPSDTSACHLTDFVGRRAQSKCTISQNGDRVTFKPAADATGEYFAFLTPLNAPPRVLNADGPSRYSSAYFNHLTDGVIATAAQVVYNQPWPASWSDTAGYAADTQDLIDSASDFFEFKLQHAHIGIDVGLIDNSIAPAPFSPYTSPLAAFHFREEVQGSPFFWIGQSYAYNGEPTYSYSETDNFRITRINATDLAFTQNGSPLETFTPAVMPTHINPFVFMGKWGWDAAGIPPAYSLQPGIKQAFVQIGGSDCVTGFYLYDAIVPGTWPDGPPDWDEWVQWGISFNTSDSAGDASIFDPNNPGGGVDPVFGFDTNTRCEFSLEGGNVVVRIYDWINYLDNITDVAGVGVFTFSRPFADTDKFTIQPPASGYPIGPPTHPFLSLEYAYVNAVANAPLRLGVVATQDSDWALPAKAGIKEVSFTFADEALSGPADYAGGLRVGGADSVGNSRRAPDTYRFKDSLVCSNPDGSPVTLDDFNNNQPLYKRTE